MAVMDNENEFPEKFSDDEEEQLRIENEILRMKLKAELGGEIEGIEGTENLPPEIENLFLKNILSFEHQYEQVAATTIYQIIQEPVFTKVENLNESDLEIAFANINQILEDNNIAVDYRGDYTIREKYRFVTEDLFNHETKLVHIDGMTTHYSYEEFYPNHKLAIEDQANEFIAHWFDMNFDENSWELSDEFLTDTQQIVSKATVLQKFNNIFAAYKAFEDPSFFIGGTSFEMNELDKTMGFGYAEGGLKFSAVLESNETIQIESQFKLYLQLDEGDWRIFFFYWPGFTW
jgi:hypothetical protein